MGGAAPTPSGKGGKKPLDAAINLVPFIDLLSCCISFLLITAVWTQLARMDVTQKSKSNSAPTDEPPQNQVTLTLFVNKDNTFTFSKSTGESIAIEAKADDYDYVKLADTLAQAKKDHADKEDLTIKTDDVVVYQKIIKTMDIAISAKFPTVTLTDKGAGG
ncbi:MAG TPA: biopolymer transporter ExbD [Pseudomonadota bacterium]|jgi:biopolymer transport protein ExbD|nr:biopolymer transporter ExbD [Pseudomonadota bacterium]